MTELRKYPGGTAYVTKPQANFSLRIATPGESGKAIRADDARLMKQEGGRPETGY